MCSAKKKEVVNVNHPIQPPKIPLFQDSFKVFKVLDTWNIHELKRYAYYIVRWLQIMKFMKNGHVSFYPVILRIQTGSSNFRSSFRILKIPMENSGGSPLARFPPRTQALTASTIASLSASSWMPKPPEKSRKLCDVWSFFPPCPGLFWGVEILVLELLLDYASYSWLHNFQTYQRFNSVFTGIKQYSLLSFKLKKKRLQHTFHSVARVL